MEIQEREIDGNLYRFNPLMATEARKILVGLIQRFGGSVASGVEGLAGADIENIDGDTELSSMLGKMAGSVAGIIRQVALNLSPEFYEKLAETFGKRTEIRVETEDGQSAWLTLSKGDRDLRFGNKLLTEAKWIGFCLEAQYSDFFELAGKASRNLMDLGLAAKTKSRSNSQKD